MNSGSSNLETRSLLDELSSFNKGGLFNLGHPLLNRIVESFVKAAGLYFFIAYSNPSFWGEDPKSSSVITLPAPSIYIGAVQAVSREAYFTAVEGSGLDNADGMQLEEVGGKKHRLPGLRGETSSKSIEAMVKNTGKESFQWGLAAGIYSGLTYGLKEARGAHDWKNSAVAGALTGAALALTSDNSSHEQIVQCAITGAAISTAANLLTGIF